jgi:hypothetical protein
VSTRAVRIGNCSGFSGDRRTAIREILDGDPVDVIVGDYLAEITMAGMVGRASSGRGSGWSDDFLAQLDGNLAELLDRGVKLVVDAGAFDPAGLADQVRKIAAEEGRTVSVVHVEGDNVLDRLDELQAGGHQLTNMDTGEPLSSWPYRPLSANAYLGGWGIAAALRAGADVTICPRVTDASLVVGVAAWWHGWEPTDWDRLAGAVVAGHVIECGPQATGGNFSGFNSIPGMDRPGFPVAEVEDSGDTVITKHAGSGGAVTTDTVIAQLLYEIQGPYYLNPDVTVDLRTTRLDAEAADRVRVSATTGLAPSPTTKVAITAMNGFENSIETYLTGLDIDEKADLVLRQARKALEGSEASILRVDRIGTAATDPETMEAAMVTLRIVGRASDQESLKPANFFAPVASTILASIPGFHCESHTMRFTRPSPVIQYWPGLLATSQLDHAVVLDDGTREPVQSPPRTEPPPVEPASIVAPDGPNPFTMHTERVPLGRIAHTRSGDKGGNSNVGIWVRPGAWTWLRAALTVETFRDLFPEARELKVSRHEFANLCAVHFVVHGNLGTGASSNGRLDALGKSVGEYLRARHIDVPRDLLDGGLP